MVVGPDTRPVWSQTSLRREGSGVAANDKGHAGGGGGHLASPPNPEDEPRRFGTNQSVAQMAQTPERALILSALKRKLQQGAARTSRQGVLNLDLICCPATLTMAWVFSFLLRYLDFPPVAWRAISFAAVWTRFDTHFCVHLITSACGSNSDSLCQAF